MIVQSLLQVRNLVVGTFLALLVIIGVDRSIDPIWDEYSEVVSVGPDHVILRLFVHKVRGLCPKNPAEMRAFAIDLEGRHRRIDAVPLSARKQTCYPRGFIDLGRWKFTDVSVQPRLISEIELVVPYACITGTCKVTIGPFYVEE